jgi:uncharacterized repeat protein (TIGR03803 family)
MLRNRSLILVGAALAAILGFLITADPAAAASKETVLYSFKDNGTDGRLPLAGLISDDAGNLYGTTGEGGVSNMGTVFELEHGTWAEKVLYSFAGGTDGESPAAALIFDLAGNLYGTTELGGAYGAYGTVFELAPGTGGRWTETVLHSFGKGKDGQAPEASLIFDAAGNLYGTTYGGGAHADGTVFALTPGTNGKWTEKVLHSFDFWDGETPVASLVFDAGGNLYGTTSSGNRLGTAFQLAPSADGKWTARVLASEIGAPCAPLIFDSAGNLYGTSSGGARYPVGDAFQLIPGAGGTWTEKVIHGFDGYSGGHPQGGLIFDTAGNLYGTTTNGGTGKPNAGVVFELSPGADGTWVETVLHRFQRNGKDGANPYGELVRDSAGNLYGTTLQGGSPVSGCNGSGCGTVFEITQ